MNVQYQRHLALGVAVTVALTGLLVVAPWIPRRPAVFGTIPTGASFSLVIARSGSAQAATTAAAHVQDIGLPAFTRSLSGARQVIVGPYVSIDEAEAAQRLLARRGFGRGRMLVDESVRRTPGVEGVALINASSRAGAAEGGPAVPALVAVAAAGRLSVVIELPTEPRYVETRRPEGTVLEVDTGPVTTAIASQGWNAPDGVVLINQVSAEKHGGPGGTVLRTRVTMPALTQSNVRVVGRRVYIDFWAPQGRGEQSLRASASLAEDDEEADVPAANPEDAYRDAIGPVIARVGEIEPFLMSAAASPTPEVLAAVGKTLGAVQEWISTIKAPADSVSSHDLMTASIRMAVQAVHPEFTGDRTAQARQAVAQFRAATPRPPQWPAGQL